MDDLLYLLSYSHPDFIYWVHRKFKFPTNKKPFQVAQNQFVIFKSKVESKHLYLSNVSEKVMLVWSNFYSVLIFIRYAGGETEIICERRDVWTLDGNEIIDAFGFFRLRLCK